MNQLSASAKDQMLEQYYMLIKHSVHNLPTWKINDVLFFGHGVPPYTFRKDLKEAGIKGSNMIGESYSYIPTKQKIIAFLSFLLERDGVLNVTFWEGVKGNDTIPQP